MNNFFFYTIKENIGFTRNLIGLRRRYKFPFYMIVFDFYSPHLYDFFFLSDEHYSIYFRDFLNRNISSCPASESNIVWDAYDRWGFLNQRYCLLQKDNWFYILRAHCSDKSCIRKNILILDRSKYNTIITHFYNKVYFTYCFDVNNNKDEMIKSKFKVIDHYDKLRLKINDSCSN